MNSLVRWWVIAILLFVTSNLISQSIVYIYPNNASQGQVIAMDIVGQNTHFNQGPLPTAWLEKSSSIINADSIEVFGSTSIKAHFTLPMTAQTGNWNIKINDSIDGTLTKPNGFILNTNPYVPQISSLAPNGGYQGQSLSVTVSGQNTHFNHGNGSTFWLSNGSQNINAISVNVVSSNILVAQIAIPTNSTPGQWDVNVQNSLDGHIVLTGGFYLTGNPNPPQIITISPDSLSQGQSAQLTVIGKNTHFSASGGSQFWLKKGNDSVGANNPVVIGDSVMNVSVTIPVTAQIGYWDVYTHNAEDSTIIKYSGLYVKSIYTPQLYSISPDSCPRGDSVYLTLKGKHTNFLSAQPTTIWFEDSQGTLYYPDSTIILNDTVLQMKLVIPVSAEVGFYDITAQNSIDGQITWNNAFEVLWSAGLNDLSYKFNVTVFPNPVNDVLTIDMISFTGKVTIEVLNAKGRVEEYFLTDENKINLNMSAYAKGVYFIRIESGDDFMIKKVIRL